MLDSTSMRTVDWNGVLYVELLAPFRSDINQAGPFEYFLELICPVICRRCAGAGVERLDDLRCWSSSYRVESQGGGILFCNDIVFNGGNECRRRFYVGC